MKKYFQIVKAYFRYSVMLEMEYKFNFFFGGVFELLWLIMYVALINVIFLGTTDIAGWEKYEVLMLTFQRGLIDALVTLTVVPGLSQIPEYVNTGKMDFVLLKPINTRFHLSLRNFSLDQIKNVLINIWGIIYCLQKLQMKIGFGTICTYLLLTIGSILIIYNIMFMLLSLSFWVIKMDVVMNFCAELITIGNKPYTIYPTILQKILTYGLPIIVAFNFPILNILRGNFFELISMTIIIIMIWFIITNIILKRGLKKYVGTGN